MDTVRARPRAATHPVLGYDAHAPGEGDLVLSVRGKPRYYRLREVGTPAADGRTFRLTREGETVDVFLCRRAGEPHVCTCPAMLGCGHIDGVAELRRRGSLDQDTPDGWCHDAEGPDLDTMARLQEGTV